MLSSISNSLRVFKGLYDLSFSEDQFQQARAGWHNPALAKTYVRKPFKIALGILTFVLLLALIGAGQ
jgi:hypothetical protein